MAGHDASCIFTAVMGSPLLSGLESICAPDTSACQWSGDPPDGRTAPCALLGLPVPVHAAWVPACAPSVCAACSPVGEQVPIGVGPHRKGSSGVSFVQSPSWGWGPPRPWDPPSLGPHAIPADISPYPGRARPQFSVLLSVVVGERGCLILWCGAWAPACPLQVPGWPSRARNFPNSSIAVATWCWDRQGLSPSGLPR